MKQTLLEMTQSILSALDGDEISSISDTTESLQVANIVKGVYIDIVSGLDLPERYAPYELLASGSSSLPTVMYLPSDAQSLIWVKYDKRETGETFPRWTDISFQPLDEFLAVSLSYDPTDDSTIEYITVTVSGDTFTLGIKNDTHPTKYTTWDDYTVLFDSFDETLDSTLQKDKTFCYGKKGPSFTLSDSFTPALDAEQFSLLVNKAKERAFAEMKQTQNVNAGREARFQLIHQQRTNKIIRDPQGAMRDLPDYGRKR